MTRLTLLFFFVVYFVVPALADTFTFNGGGGDLGGTSKDYTLGTMTFTAMGVFGGDLFEKCCGADETGLGLTNDPSGDDEIWHARRTQDFIQLDLTNLINAGYTGFGFVMNSVQDGEGYHISECSTSATDCGTTNSISLADPYVDLSATSGNVLLNGMTFTPPRGDPPPPVPEPSSLLLFGSVLVGVVGAVKRKFRC